MNTTVTGELIQMNSKMVVTSTAETMIIVGMIICAVFAVCAAAWIERYRVAGIVCMIIALVGLAFIFAGANEPRVQEIHACVNGPVSLELIASRYDILKVDGKELILRVRGN